jgi:hypothetical protein
LEVTSLVIIFTRLSTNGSNEERRHSRVLLILHTFFVGHYVDYVDYGAKRVKFLVEWDPSSLIQPSNEHESLLHYVAKDFTFREFQLVFEYGIRYYPKKIGINLLFRSRRRYKEEMTPFQRACIKYKIDGGKKVMNVVKTTLANCYTSSSSSSSSSSDNILSLNVVEALIMVGY